MPSFIVEVHHTSLSVADLDAQPGARCAYVKDPEGNLLELIQLP